MHELACSQWYQTQGSNPRLWVCRTVRKVRLDSRRRSDDTRNLGGLILTTWMQNTSTVPPTSGSGRLEGNESPLKHYQRRRTVTRALSGVLNARNGPKVFAVDHAGYVVQRQPRGSRWRMGTRTWGDVGPLLQSPYDGGEGTGGRDGGGNAERGCGDVGPGVDDEEKVGGDHGLIAAGTVRERVVRCDDGRLVLDNATDSRLWKGWGSTSI